MRNIEFEILSKKYQEVLDDPGWKAFENVRHFLDRQKAKVINETERKKSALAQVEENYNAFENLFNDYQAVTSSKIWAITRPLSYVLKRINKGNSNSKQKVNTLHYEKWIEENENEDNKIIDFSFKPLISIVVPVYNVKEVYLKECVESVLKQTYQNFELLLIDDKSTSQETIDALKKYENNVNIKVIYKDTNGGISSATNVGFKNATGEYIALLDNDDVIAPNALYEVVKAINENNNIELIYSDEDKINEEGTRRFMPRFKSDFCPELIFNNNYFCHFLVIKKSLVEKTGEMDSHLDGAQDFDYVLRCVDNTLFENIYHINKILYHWRAILGSTSLDVSEKSKVVELSNEVKNRTINRRGLNAFVENDGNVYYKSDLEKVSIVIPSKDNFDMLKLCLESLTQNLTYSNYEVVIVDNGSSDSCKEKINSYISDKNNIKYIYQPMEFNFSKSCNIGVENSDGKYILLLNDDVEVIQADLLERMTGYAALAHVGAVGTKLLYPNSKTIQHCGVLNTHPGPTHYLQGLNDGLVYHEGFNRIVVNSTAVTGACLMIERKKFDEVDGFDESFSLDYNDIDLCFKLIEKGYYNVEMNNIYSYHHESMTRKIPNERIILLRGRKLYDKHPDMYLVDKCYNTNYALGNNNFSY